MAQSPQQNEQDAPGAGSGVRLLCFPPAGGNSSMFRDWGRRLPAAVKVVAVELPGRQGRFKEPPVGSLPRLVPLLARELRPWATAPLALLGHSVGALIAFEFAREMRREGLPPPVHLFVSSYPAPQLPRRGSPVHALPEPLFLQRVSHLLPRAALADKELLNLILPVLRADCALGETYQYADEPPLDCPIMALGGSWDPSVLRADLKMWQQQARGGFSLHLFPGGHDYLRTAPGRLLETISEALEKYTGPAA